MSYLSGDEAGYPYKGTGVVKEKLVTHTKVLEWSKRSWLPIQRYWSGQREVGDPYKGTGVVKENLVTHTKVLEWSKRSW